jgi:iron complex transport system substrate-binding protein
MFASFNKVNGIGIIIFYGIIMPIFIISCSSSPKKHSNIEVVDFRGQKINLEKPAERIVCLIESATSGLFMLDLGKNIVGVSTNIYDDDIYKYYSVLDERIKNKSLPTPGNWDFVSIESVVALKPDIVIIWASQTESINALENIGIPVYGVMLNSYNDVYKEIEDFGILTGKTQRADSLISYTKAEVEKLKKAAGRIENKKSIYFMWAQGMLETSGKNSTVNQLIELGGCTNVCIENEEHLIVNSEKIIEWNPDIILMWCNSKMEPEDVLKKNEWQSINAVKNKNVFELPSIFYSDLWTLKFPQAARFLMHNAYPKLDISINPDSSCSEMTKFLYNTTLPLP